MYDSEDVLWLLYYHDQDVTCFILKAQYPWRSWSSYGT